MPVGWFEIMFGQAAQYFFTYREKTDEASSLRSNNDCFFIRKQNWVKLCREAEESPELGVALRKLEGNIIT